MKTVILLLLIPFLPLFPVEETTSVDTLVTGSRRLYKLEGIKVIADKPEASIGKMISKDYTIIGIQPELNLGESVSDINGLNLTSGGKSGSNLNIRGFNEKQIKILIDGRPVSGGYFGSVDLNTIPVSGIREIQIIKGPVSALYGSDTMGGVVNFITENPPGGFELIAGLLAKRNNTNKLYLTTSGRMENWDYKVFFSRFNTDGFMLSDDFESTAFEEGEVRNQNASEQYDFQSEINWTLLDFHSFSIKAGYTWMPDKEITPSIYERNYRKFLDWKRWQLSAGANFMLRFDLEAITSLYYDQYDDSYAEFSDPGFENMYLQWPSDLSSWTFGLSQNFDWQTSGSWRNRLGFRYEKQAYNRKDNGSYPEWTSNNLQQHNLYWQSELDLAGLKITSGCAVSLFRQKHRDNWITHLQPSAAVYYTLPFNFKLSAAYSHNTKYPTLHELFSRENGNEDLKEEEADKLELNLEFPFVWAEIAGSVSQSIYYNMIRDMIDRTQSGYENFSEIDSYGYELELNLHLLWDHEITYSRIEMEENEDFALLEVPRNTFRIRESVKLPFDFRLVISSEWKDIRKTEISTELPAYWLHNAYISREWNRYSVMLGLENILDKNYQQEFGFPGEGFNFVINLEVKVF